MTSSANNSTNVPLNGGGSWVGLWEAPNDTIQGVQILINTNVSGTAYIQFSQDRSRVEYEHAYGVIGGIALYKVERRKAKYIRAKYVNDASAQSLMLLHTTYLTDYEKEDLPITIDAEDSNILMFGELPSGELQAIKLDASGNLRVSGISGGGVTSDVNITNSLLSVKDASAIEQMTTETDRLLYDLDVIANRLHDISGSVSIVNFPEVQEVSGVFWQETQPVSIASVVDVSGSLSISNLPAVQEVSGVFWQETQPVSIASVVDVSGSLSISNFPAVQEVSGVFWQETQPVSIASQLSVRDSSAITQLEVINASIDGLGTQYLFSPPTQPASVDFTTYASQIAQGSTWSLATDGQDGWQFINTQLGGASLFMYSNTTLTPLGQEDNMTLGSVLSMFFVGNYPIVYNSSEDKQFYIAIYTKPTGSGDIEPWFHSKRVYTLPSSVVVSKGGDRFYYAGLDVSTIYKDLEHIQYQLTIEQGDCNPNEIVQFISLAVDSSTPVGQFSGIVKAGGYQSAGNTLKIVKYANTRDLPQVVEISGNVDCNVSFPLVQVVDVSGAVDVSGLSFTDGKLSVVDLSSVSHLSAIEDILENGYVNVYDASCELVLEAIKTQTDKLTFENDGLRVYVDNNSSGGDIVEISGVGLYEDNLKVIDLALNQQLSQFSFFTGEDEVTDLRTRVMGSVEVINPVGVSLSVTETAPLTGFATETTLEAVKSQTDKLSFYADAYGAYDLRTQIVNSGDIGVSINNQPTVSLSALTEVGLVLGTQVGLVSGSSVSVSGDVGLTAGTTVGLSVGTGVDVLNFPTKQSVFVENTAEGYDLNVNVTNASFAITSSSALDTNITNASIPITSASTLDTNITNASIPITSASTLDTNITNSSVDVRSYASSNGTDWHHIKSDPTGHLIVHSETRDGNNNRITSTEEGAKRGLDVNLINTSVPVSNTDGNALYSRSRDISNAQVATNASVSGPMRIGNANADTQGYTYISAIMSFTSVTTGGNVYLEVSHDENLWARPSGASTFVNTSVANVTASILLSSPVPFRYARLFADTGLNASGCNAWIVMK